MVVDEERVDDSGNECWVEGVSATDSMEGLFEYRSPCPWCCRLIGGGDQCSAYPVR